jgi:glycosyltransferase involved in cell wall biosynthesis
MKIAQIAPLAERVPPKKYGGTERVIFTLTEELVKRGHEVTLFASGDSKTSAKLVSVYPRSLREAGMKNIYISNVWQMHNIGLAYLMQDEFDIIHDHMGTIGLPTANIAHKPVVITMHGPFNLEDRAIYRRLRMPYVVAISKSQAQPAPDLHYGGMVYNGLNMEEYPFSREHDGYLLFVGRISMEKGTHLAIQAAQELNLPLIIAAKLEPTDMPYFKAYVGPELSENIRWVGEVDEEERNRLMSRAMCFLHPVTWREPFGLTLIEAMACGCPVVAINKGSIPEIVLHEKTGYVVSDVDEIIDAIRGIDKIDRTYCRAYALQTFNGKRMADGYEEIYRKILGGEFDA